MCDKVVTKEPFINQDIALIDIKLKKMCVCLFISADAFPPTLKFVPDCFFTNKMLEKLFDVVFSNDDIVFSIKDSDNVTFLVMI